MQGGEPAKYAGARRAVARVRPGRALAASGRARPRTMPLYMWFSCGLMLVLGFLGYQWLAAFRAGSSDGGLAMANIEEKADGPGPGAEAPASVWNFGIAVDPAALPVAGEPALGYGPLGAADAAVAAAAAEGDLLVPTEDRAAAEAAEAQAEEAAAVANEEEEERAAAGAAPEDRNLSGEPGGGGADAEQLGWDGGLSPEEAANRTEAGAGGNRTAPAAVDQNAWDRLDQRAGAEPVHGEPPALLV